MCLCRRQLDPKSRRILSASYLCLALSCFLLIFLSEHGPGHRHSILLDSLRFLLPGLAIGLAYWFALRNRTAHRS